MTPYKQRVLVLSSFLLLLVVRESYSELMCYVCDHCSSITPGTPSVACNADHFSVVGAELPSTMTTNSPSETMQPDTTTVAAMTTTEETASKDNSTMTSTPTTTTTTTSTSILTSTLMATSTEGEIKSTLTPVRPQEEPGSVQVHSESTGMTTVPFVDSIKPIIDSVFSYNTTMMADEPPVVDEDVTNMTTTTSRSYMNSSTFRVRQARHVMPAESGSDSGAMTYHCYTVQVVSNSTLDTRRGCARVAAVETVCGQLKKASSGKTPVNKCSECSTDHCNGSSALSVSMAAVLLGLVAAMLKP